MNARIAFTLHSDFRVLCAGFLRAALSQIPAGVDTEHLITSVITTIVEICKNFCTSEEDEVEIRITKSGDQFSIMVIDPFAPHQDFRTPVSIPASDQIFTGYHNETCWRIRTVAGEPDNRGTWVRPTGEPPDPHQAIDIHRMDPDEADGVTRVIFEVYGTSYPKKFMYQAEAVRDKNSSGEIISFVAVTASGMVVGHCDISDIPFIPGYLQIGALAVVPAYRGRGIAKKLFVMIVAEAQKHGAFFLGGGHYAAHTVSQKNSYGNDLRTSAILLGSTSNNISFPGLTESLPQRETFVFMGKIITPVSLPLHYLPIHHYAIITHLMRYLSLSAPTKPEESSIPGVLKSSCSHSYNDAKEAGTIVFDTIGKDFDEMLHRLVREILSHEAKEVHLLILLSDPHAPYATCLAEKAGFFFAGIFPSQNGIYLSLQYLTRFAFDYCRVNLHEPVARQLLSYIAEQDPSAFNQKPDQTPKTLVVVDALSSGRFLPPYIRKKGLHCVHVISSREIPQGYHVTVEELIEQTRKICDDVLVYDGNPKNLINALEPYQVIGIIPGTETGVFLSDMISEMMGIPSNGVDLSEARRNKSLMQQAVRNAGVRTKKFYSSDTIDEIVAFAEENCTYPVVIKPLDAAGTDGVTFCDDKQAVVQACNALQGTQNALGSLNTKILVEERLFGTEFGVNTVSWGGHHKLVELWQYRKERVEGRSVIYDCTKLHRWPVGEEMDIVRYTFSVLDALGIKFGPAHTEIMLTSSGPVLVESGARPMGGQVPPNFIEDCIGQSQIEQTILAYGDNARFLEHLNRPYLMKKFMIRKHLISRLEGAPQEEIYAIDKIIALQSSYAGDFVGLIENWYVHKTEDMLTSPAVVFLIHEDEQVVIEDYKKIREMEKNSEYEFYGKPSL